MRHLKATLIAVAVLAGLSSTAVHAQSTNLLQDGDFSETAQGFYNGSHWFGPWEANGYGVYVNSDGAGGQLAVLAGYYGGMSQSFQAVAGTTYTLSLLTAAQGNGQPFTVSLGGASTVVPYGQSSTTWLATTLTWTATSSGTDYVSINNQWDWLHNGTVVDNVVLTGVAAAVPEPSSVALMLAGIGCVGWVVRRRQAAA